MRLIYTKDGFSKNEKEEWRVIIFNNILDGLRMTIDAMEEFGIPFEYENTTVRKISKFSPSGGCAEPSLTYAIAGPSPSHHARKGSSPVRTYPRRISASFQGYVEGPWNSKSG